MEEMAEIKAFGFSRDGAATTAVYETYTVELTALCCMCGIAGEFNKLELAHPRRKPKNWALHYGGTQREPKRFFICEGCAKVIVRRASVA